MSEEDSLETVLETSDPSLVATVKMILEGEGIPHYVQGEIHSAIQARFPVRVMVPKSAAAKAREALADFL